MKKIIILVAMLCAFASAECKINNYSGEKFINVFCKDEVAELSITMKKSGESIHYIEKFNNKIIDVIIYAGDERTSCVRTDKDEYGVVINKKSWFGCKTPGERWNELRKAYEF